MELLTTMSNIECTTQVLMELSLWGTIHSLKRTHINHPHDQGQSYVGDWGPPPKVKKKNLEQVKLHT